MHIIIEDIFCGSLFPAGSENEESLAAKRNLDETILKLKKNLPESFHDELASLLKLQKYFMLQREKMQFIEGFKTGARLVLEILE